MYVQSFQPKYRGGGVHSDKLYFRLRHIKQFMQMRTVSSQTKDLAVSVSDFAV